MEDIQSGDDCEAHGASFAINERNSGSFHVLISLRRLYPSSEINIYSAIMYIRHQI